jgi:hypothetical protein
MEMPEYFAVNIMNVKDDSGLTAAQDKYKAYFVKPYAKMLYGKYQSATNTLLETSGYGDCIVTV